MPINKFEKIRLALHFNNSNNLTTVGHLERDRIFKIRPIIKYLNERFTIYTVEQMLSTNEQMCSRKVSQNPPNKPHKWGFKWYVLYNLMGCAHMFKVYFRQKNLKKFDEPDLSATEKVVVRAKGKLCRLN